MPGLSKMICLQTSDWHKRISGTHLLKFIGDTDEKKAWWSIAVKSSQTGSVQWGLYCNIAI